MGNTPIKRVKLNYMPAVSKTPPVGKITVHSSEMEKLDRSIREKCEQRADLENRARENFKDSIVK